MLDCHGNIFLKNRHVNPIPERLGNTGNTPHGPRRVYPDSHHTRGVIHQEIREFLNINLSFHII